MTVEVLNSDHVAQYWGCEPHNKCYFDCAHAAQLWLEDAKPEELQKIFEWANQYEWV
jgi:hypothetical protein